MFRAYALVVICFLLFPLVSFAIGSNAGIIQGLWYSQEKIFDGDTVRIYVAVRNNTQSDLTGTVDFFDGDKKLGQQHVQALSGRIIESWADWGVVYGEHKLRAEFSQTELHPVGTGTEKIQVTSRLAEDTLTIDYDTDKDGIGNKIDTDDDGDSISDVDEIRNGTNPLVPDFPKKVTPTASSTPVKTATKTRPLGKISAENLSSSSSANAGFEKYLAPSPAQIVLSDVTNYITTAKQNIDTYRNTRAERLQEETALAVQIPVDAKGFGEITRTQSGGTQKNATKRMESSSGIFEKSTQVASGVLSIVYTGILTGFSFILGHTMFVQLGILLLILYLLLRLAAKFGRRKKKV